MTFRKICLVSPGITRAPLPRALLAPAVAQDASPTRGSLRHFSLADSWLAFRPPAKSMVKDESGVWREIADRVQESL